MGTFIARLTAPSPFPYATKLRRFRPMLRRSRIEEREGLKPPAYAPPTMPLVSLTPGITTPPRFCHAMKLLQRDAQAPQKPNKRRLNMHYPELRPLPDAVRITPARIKNSSHRPRPRRHNSPL